MSLPLLSRATERQQLRPYQSASIAAIFERWDAGDRATLLVLATGLGKCLGRGTPVLMFDGTIRPVEDVRQGDLLMGPDSAPRRVVSTCAGREPLYRVTPTKGEPYVVNESHILSLKLTNSRPLWFGGERHENGAIVNVGVRDYLASNRSFKHRAKGWRAAVDFDPLPLHPDLPPYILGVWLGDGTSEGPSVTSVDAEIVAELESYASTRGMTIRTAATGDRCDVHHVTTGRASPGRGHETNPMKKALRALGLLGNKHVPHAYLTAPRAARLELLAGLMDTDGSAIPRGGFDYISKVEALADAVCFLARSLGLAAYKRGCRKVCTNNGVAGWYHRVQISGDCEAVPCRIPRKRSPVRRQKKSVLVTGIRVEPIGEGDYFGFEIDGPDRLFLLGDFTVTHNTTCFAEVARMTVANGGRVLVVAHRTELLDQAKARLESFGLDVGVEQAGRRAGSHSVVVASVQTMQRARLKRWRPDRFELVVIDEAHHAAAKSYRTIIDHFATAKILGVTATPDRSDGAGLRVLFDSMAYRYEIAEAIRDGWLSPITARRVVVDGLDLSAVRTTAGDLNQGDLDLAMRAPEAVHGVAAPLVELSEDRQTLAFTVTVEHAHAIAEAVNEIAPGSAVALDGGSDKDHRAAVLRRFHAGDIRVLVNCALFTEGFDAPATSCIAIARPTKSRALYAQMVGRGTRLAPGKEDCRILDFAGIAGKHSLIGPADVLAGRELDDDERAEVEALLGGGPPQDVLLAIDEAEDRARVKRERKKPDPIAWSSVAIDLFGDALMQGHRAEWAGVEMTAAQADYLERKGVELDALDKAKAASLIEALRDRQRNDLCTYKQANILGRHGINAAALSFKAASELIDGLARNRWKPTTTWLDMARERASEALRGMQS